ncbi:A-kinase anchor protein 13 isoform X2 [Trichomycterus rosablanca]|uniref:A-kinase anchor protein 13 isoform X2 n=1 Tax=Trichomycterus rosablanca TaxID=2290929 RepID=UPI002F35F673
MLSRTVDNDEEPEDQVHHSHVPDADAMKLNPKQAPLYGECVLTVQLNEEECVNKDEDDVEFYLLFSGSTQRHLTSTLRVSHVTLQAVCPAHDRDETVRVTLCQARPGGPVDQVAEERFQYVHDLALDMAHFLVKAAARGDGLEAALLFDDSHASSQERLDEALTLALKHLPLPSGWSVLGTDVSTHSGADLSPHDTLLHFAARRGLRKVALFLLQQPGGRDALQLVNKYGYTPVTLAERRGHTQLRNLLSELEKSPRLETKPQKRCYPAGPAFLHHPRLDTYTLTVQNEPGADPPDLKRDVKKLRRHIRSQRSDKGGSVKHSVPLILTPHLGDVPPAVATPAKGLSVTKAQTSQQQEVTTHREKRTLDPTLSDSLRSGSEPHPCPNGTDRSASGDQGAGDRDGPGGSDGTREDCVSVSGASCAEQQQEEVDKEPSIIRAERAAAGDEERNKIQSGNTPEGSMGQTQSHPEGTPEKGGTSEESREERGGTRPSRLEISPSVDVRPPAGDGKPPGSEQDSSPALNLDVEACRASEERSSGREETGNHSERSENTTPGGDISNEETSASDPALALNMAPGPVHHVHLEPSALDQQSHMDVPGEKPSNHQEGAMKSSETPDKIADSVPDVPLVEERPEETGELTSPSEDQTPAPQSVKSTDGSSAEPRADFQPAGGQEPPSRDLPQSHRGDNQDDEAFLGRIESSRTELLKDTRMVDEQTGPIVSPKLDESGSSPDEAGSGSSGPQSTESPEENLPVESKPLEESEISEMATLLSQMRLNSPSASITSDAGGSGGKICTMAFEFSEAPSAGDAPKLPDAKNTEEKGLEVEPGPEMTPLSKDPDEIEEKNVASELEKDQTSLEASKPPLESSVESVPEENISGASLKVNWSRSTVEENVEETSDDPHPERPTSEENVSGTSATNSQEESVEEASRDQRPKIIVTRETVTKTFLHPSSENPVHQENVQGTSPNKRPEVNEDTEPTGDTATVEEKPLEDLTSMENLTGTSCDPKPEVSSSEEAVGETSLDKQPDVNEDMEPTGDTTTVEEKPEGTPCELALEGLTGTSCDPKLEVSTSEKAIGETSLDKQPDVNKAMEPTGDTTTVEEKPLEDLTSMENLTGTSCDPKLEVSTSEKAIGETSLDKQPDVNKAMEPTGDTTTVEEKPEGTPCELALEGLTGTSCDPKLEVSTSEKAIGETSLDKQPKVSEDMEPTEDTATIKEKPEGTACELALKGLTGTSCNPKLEVSSSEEAAGETSLDPQPDSSTSEEIAPRDLQLDVPDVAETSQEHDVEDASSERTFAEAPPDFQTDHTDSNEDLQTDLDTPVSVLNISSDVSSISTQPVDVSSPLDLESGTTLDVDAGSSVEVDSGLVQDLPPAEAGGPEACGTLDEEEKLTEQEREEKPDEEPIKDEAAGSDAVLTPMDPTEIRRDSEVLYSLDSDMKDQAGAGDTCTGGSGRSVCRSVSASSLPDSVSDGDSLLGPDTPDHGFKQSDDTSTLTSGVSVGGSISTDDSSVAPPAGEPEEEETKDGLSEVLQRAVVLRPPGRSLSPARRHSWEPAKDRTGDSGDVLGQRSVGQSEEGEKAASHRRSMSWCPSDLPQPHVEEMNTRSYSLDGLDDEQPEKNSADGRSARSGMEREDRGSLASLTEEEREDNMGENSSLDSQRSVQDVRGAFVPPHTLTKSVSMSAISPRDLDDLGSLMSVSGSLERCISEEDPAPLRTDTEIKGTKVSRTFSYLKNKIKKKEKDRDKNKDGKEKEKRSSSGHLFSSAPAPPTSTCAQCNRPIGSKDALTCTNCSVCVHKGCRDGLPVCAKVKMKLQQQQPQTVPDSAAFPGPAARGKPASARDRPWSTILVPEDPGAPPVPPPRRNPAVMSFPSNPLSKSISISNIAGQADDAPLKTLKFLSQSTDSLNKLCRVNESTESLADEGTELTDVHLMAEFEADARDLEADSWSLTVDKKFLKQLKKDVIKRQDVIYELIQTELHHVRTLRIMADVYSRGLQKEVQVEVQTLDKMFPVLDDLLELHTQFLSRLLERRRTSGEGNEGGFVIRRIGDVVLDQVTGSNAERMKKVYGKFCSRHNEAVNIYKELHARDKRFQAFIKKMMSSAVVRRHSIPECILLVTQRLTKYPVLLQRILQHTRDPEEEQADVAEALRQVKEVITGVESKVNEYEKRRRLKEVYSRTDSKSIMRMKSGQMFAREDLIRRKLVHDGPLQVKNAAGRLKDVQALLLSDVLVFLQEKDQKFVFASLDQRSTVISLQKLIVREVANEERGLFFITAGIERPEMVEGHVGSKEERNTWMQLIQDATNSIEKDDDEGLPSENEEDKRMQESRAKEMRDQLQKKDQQIVALLEDKVRLFHELCDCSNQDDVAAVRNRAMFRATPDDVTRGEPIIRDAVKEVETLQELVTHGLVGQQACVGPDGSSVCAGSVSLPRRSETFGGFDSHQMNVSKSGDREETDDLRRTESDGVLKKGGSANLLLLHKRNIEQVLQSVSRLHDLLSTLQAVVVQQDTFIEEQRQTSPSLRHPSISSSSSSFSSSSSSLSSRPSSLMEQEKQRQEEKQREEERRRKEEEERRRKGEDDERRRREEELARREERLMAVEEENRRRSEVMQQEQQELGNRKEEYQRELLKLRDDQRRLEREREQLSVQHIQEEAERRQRASSTASEDSLKLQNLAEAPEGAEVFSRADSKRKAKNLNPFSSSAGQKGGATEQHSQIPARLLQLTKPKEKKEKKKKKGKGKTSESAGETPLEPSADGEVFC